jgi:hypothetical protein
LKSKLEAVSYGLTTVEKEFLSEVIVKLPQGGDTTIGEAIAGGVAKGEFLLGSGDKDKKNVKEK